MGIMKILKAETAAYHAKDDLHFFEPRISSDNTPSIEAALSMTEKIRLRSIEQPTSLLGYLYVTEGSTLGNHMH